MATLQLPPAAALGVLLKRNYPGEIGGPFGESYVAHKYGITEKVPKITFLVNPEDSVRFANAFVNVKDVISASLSQNVGPWNVIFASNGYWAFTWVIFAMILTMLVSVVVLMILRRRLVLIKSLIIAMIGIFSGILYLVESPMKQATWNRYFLDQLALSLYNLSFYLLLDFWCDIVSAVQYSRNFRIFRKFIKFGILCLVVSTLIAYVWLFVAPNDALTVVRSIMRILSLVVQVVLGLLMFGYAIRFKIRRVDAAMEPGVLNAYEKIKTACVISFVLVYLNSIFVVVLGQPESVGNVRTVSALLIIMQLIALFRNVQLLILVNTEVPAYFGTVASSSSSIFSGIKGRMSVPAKEYPEAYTSLSSPQISGSVLSTPPIAKSVGSEFSFGLLTPSAGGHGIQPASYSHDGSLSVGKWAPKRKTSDHSAKGENKQFMDQFSAPKTEWGSQ